jgi:phenylacetate-CoA ligase
MPSFFDRIYAKSPVWLQNIGISAYGLVWRNRRFGGSFSRQVDEYRSHEGYSKKDWEEYQTKSLRSLLPYTVAQVPYYRESLRDVPGYPEFRDFTLEDLINIPILTKEDIRKCPQKFIAEDINPKKIHYYFTSGTTGTPLAIAFTTDSHREWSAIYETRVREWAGVNYKMSRSMIGGRLVVPKAEAQPPFWRYNVIEHQLYMSAFHISPENAQHYAAALNHYKPDYLVGYASSHYFLARLFLAQGIIVHKPQAVLTSSENLTDEMRQVIQKVYDCQVFDAYSGIEACCLASECEKHHMHVSPDVGIIELIDSFGKPVLQSEPGEIVATGLLNYVQPLIRYRTGDFADWDDGYCTCGRQMPILKEILGRSEDLIILRDEKMSTSFYKVFQGILGIQEAQVIQQDYDIFTIYLVTDTSFTLKQKEGLYSNIYSRYGKVKVELIQVNNIPRTERGKFRAVISKVQRNPLKLKE